MSIVYSKRKEWKPAFYYSQKTVECNPANRTAWWNLGLAAVVLQRWKTMRLAWQQLGHTQPNLSKWIPVQMAHQRFKEVVWVKPLDLVRARVESIPHPFSRRRYGEIILHDRSSIGNLIVEQRQVPIYQEVELLERSFFDTYSVLLHTNDINHIDLLNRLCQKAELGFDNWTNTNQLHANTARNNKVEYYSKQFFKDASPEHTPDYHVIGMAAKQKAAIVEVLEAWRIISLCSYSQLERH
ncbi:MAG: hypothetical protein AAF738_05910 [Bacteroidota bacterium]